jgi:short-subunit dehydrogenase
MSQTIVISGIAQGMGREVALMLAQQGHSVCGFDLDVKSLTSLGKELDKLGNRHCLKQINITDVEGLTGFRDEVLEKYQRVDTVLSNVGVGFFGAFEELDLDNALQCLNINVIGCARLLQLFIPSMRKAKQGKLVVMSSLVGRIPFPFESLYAASKFAVEGMVESLQYELTPFNIRVALIQPAQVSTTFAAKVHTLPPKESPYYERTKRFIERDEVLIKNATDPITAAQRIVDVLQAPAPKLHNQVDLMSTVFLGLNRFLPKKVRDAILLNHMDIKV